MNQPEQPLIKIDQAALDRVIARHKLYRESRPGGKRASFIRHDLSGLVFCGCDLAYADFTGSVLYEADLEFANLDHTVFFGCDLRKANFRNAHMKQADLRGATLRGAIMSNADMTGADMREGSFAVYNPKEGLSFAGEQQAWTDGIGGVDLRGANMGSVKLSGAVAINSNFEEANLSNAKAMRANLTGANMTGANLSGADFSDCELRNASLRGANLSGILMDFSKLVNVDMTGALTDKPAGKTLDQLPMPLEQMLVAHALWLDSQGSKGLRLEVGGFDMRGAPSVRQSNLTMLLADHSVWYAHDFSHVKMQASHFAYSDLRSCNMEFADLRGSNFQKANLAGTRFCHAQLESLLLNDKRLVKTSFAGANLRYADFTGADLKNVDFTDADLSFADFTKSDLRGGIFQNSILEQTKIDFKQEDKRLIIIEEQR